MTIDKAGVLGEIIDKLTEHELLVEFISIRETSHNAAKIVVQIREKYVSAPGIER